MRTIKAAVALLRVSEEVTPKPGCRLFLKFCSAHIVPRLAEQGLPDDNVDAHDDHLADTIRALTPEDFAKMWSVLIQLKPHLNDD